jgi:hypothetical protein
MISVTLPPETVERVRAEARAVIEHGKRNKREKYGAQEDRQDTRLARNEIGFGGEEAACIWLGIDRTQRGVVVEDFKRDLADLVEVRTTEYRTGRLIVHPEDDDGAPFVFAIGVLPTFRLMGWCWGREAKHKQFWDTPPAVQFPAFFVPATAPCMKPMEELLHLVRLGDKDKSVRERGALAQARRERDAIDQRWKDLGQWPRPWTTEAGREAWIRIRARGLADVD